ncbi:hypothetical protein HDU79_009756 [Rhizoclosmatium sp. JEL0117]|nr:hypothetical protein HDU79_009756 [Rhizoclosmatium sp. JEL0117]
MQFLAVLATAVAVNAWSGPEHQMVGRIAAAFLAPETQAALNTLLPSFDVPSDNITFPINGNVSLMTTWADVVKAKKVYGWSGAYHYIDYEDVTLLDVKNKSATSVSCSTVINDISCPAGVCIVPAIANYTNRADYANKLSDKARAEAILFLTHYLGDITQPLHNCGKFLGGNNYLVKWNGSIFEPAPYQKYRHNMHFIWDQFMIEADIQDNYGNSFTAYVNAIVSDIQSPTGKYYSEAASWVSCKTPLKTDSGLVVKNVCPIEWSVEGNNFNCASVWDNTGSLDPNNPTEDLYTNGYYATNKEIARMQLAKAGLRLAAALNTLVPATPIGTYFANVLPASSDNCKGYQPPATYGAAGPASNLYSGASSVAVSGAALAAVLAMF